MLILRQKPRVSVQGVKSLGGHFACLCQGFEFYEVKEFFSVIIFQKKNRNTFTLSGWFQLSKSIIADSRLFVLSTCTELQLKSTNFDVIYHLELVPAF